MQKFQQYGKVGIITHLALSWTFFAGTFVAMNRSKNPQKIIKWLKLQNRIPAKAGSFVISGIIYKAVMPIRIAVSLMAIPIVIKVLDGEKEKKEQQILQIGGGDEKKEENILQIGEENEGKAVE